MVYVKFFDILGINTAQIPCIELQGPPTTATEGAVGLLGLDVTSAEGDTYICTAVNGAIYTWKSLRDGKDGSCVVKAEVDSKGELILTLSDGTTINAGVAKGEDGKDGLNGTDGVGVSEVELNDSGELIITLSNGNVTNVGKVKGDKGDKGADGISIVKTEVNSRQELLITLSNDTIINLGVIVPTIQNLIGTEPIGEYTSLYYDGAKFVEKPISLENASWETIAKISEDGKAREYFKVGDEKNVEFATGEQITFVILGFEHDDLADDSGKAKITFGMKNLLATKYRMDVSKQNDWESTEMFNSTLPTLFSHLPANLQAVIKPLKKVAGNRLFLFTQDDKFDSYEYYANITDSAKYVKKLSNGTGEVSDWWLATKIVNSDGSYLYYTVATSGSFGILDPTLEAGICFGFCI